MYRLTIKLSKMGSFHIGGRVINNPVDSIREVSFAKNGVPVYLNEKGTYQAEQMYIQYFIPEEVQGKYPIVFIHGGSMSGVIYETTPDGREGWLNYFLENNWIVYNSDSVERGRSGWSPYSPYLSEKPIVLPKRDPYERYRIGKGTNSYSHNIADRKFYKNSQFPVESYDQFVKQLVPRWVNTDEIIINGYIELIKSIGPCVIIAHSQGGAFSLNIAEEIPDLIKALVLIEPSMGGNMNNAERLVDIPIYAVYGDYIKQDDRWKEIYSKTNLYYEKLSEYGIDLEVQELPEIGIEGNSHMLMIDKNNMEIATLIQNWLIKKNMYKKNKTLSGGLL